MRVLLTLAATVDTPFSTEWFEQTDGYRMLLEAIGREDPNVPGVALSKADLDRVLARVDVEPRELKWVRRYASPVSRRRQRARVRSVRDVLLSERRLARGARFAKDHADLLDRVSAEYEVAPEDLVAMLNAESNFGTVQGSYTVVDVFVSQIAYLAAAERAAFEAGHYEREGAMTRKANRPRVEKRRRYAVQNLSAVLRHAKAFDLDPRSITGSWAGAIGITQFMPASLRFAKDGDGDGKVDLSTIPDAVASTAHYLVEHGYQRDSRKARRKSFHAYNPNAEYVSAIDDYARRFAKRSR